MQAKKQENMNLIEEKNQSTETNLADLGIRISGQKC